MRSVCIEYGPESSKQNWIAEPREGVICRLKVPESSPHGYKDPKEGVLNRCSDNAVDVRPIQSDWVSDPDIPKVCSGVACSIDA
jgi:hypothetical protein